MLDQVTNTATQGWNFDNSYARLPETFYSRLNPVPVRHARMAIFNHALAKSLGLASSTLADAESTPLFSGNKLPTGSEPIAQAYAGHQFGHFTMLGDGRAILLGEHITPTGNRFDIQLKGSGQTTFSRRGDGRAALGPMLREYVISEAMHALGIPTTRSLAVVTTGEPVFRESTLPGAILTRVAASHIRVGTFEYIAARGNREELQMLADYTLQRHYPEHLEADNPYLLLLHSVIDRQASLVAQWQHVGFIHGVMNTDNMTLSGETIDYGPCAFMDVYHPATVFSSIDAQGRYAFGNQPPIAQWNLARLTEALLPLLAENPEASLEHGQAAIVGFQERFEHHWLSGMRAKLGLFNEESDDRALVNDLLTWMEQTQADYTNTFRALSDDTDLDETFLSTEWYSRWQVRLNRQAETWEMAKDRMLAHNPAVIPRNHRVEEALQAATEQGDFNVLHKLLDVLRHPYRDIAEYAEYRLPAPPGEIPYRTFCGT